MDRQNQTQEDAPGTQLLRPERRASRTKGRDAATKKSAERHRQTLLARLSSPVPQSRLHSPAIERLNIQSQFFQLYMSKDGAPFPGCVFFAEHSKEHATMRSALDTLSLLAIGTSFEQPHLINQALRAYSQTLKLFRKQLDIAPVRDPFVLLQTVHVIQLCTMFRAVSPEGLGWLLHQKGLDAVLAGASPEGRKECGNRGRDLIERDNRISFSLWDGILCRKDLETAEELFATTGHRSDANMESRLVIDRRVPGVLRYTQYVVQRGKKASESAVSDAVGAIIGMEGELHAAMATWYSDVQSMAYWTSRTRDLEDLLDLSTMRTNPFPCALVFPNMGYALKHIHYWLCLLALRQVHVEIRNAVRSTTYSLSLYESIDSLLRRTEECADNLCMSIVYMTLTKNELFGLITAIPPLQMAARWYRETGNSAKLVWCYNVANRLHARGLAVPLELLSKMP